MAPVTPGTSGYLKPTLWRKVEIQRSNKRQELREVNGEGGNVQMIKKWERTNNVEIDNYCRLTVAFKCLGLKK